jgi:hypothetical protein
MSHDALLEAIKCKIQDEIEFQIGLLEKRKQIRRKEQVLILTNWGKVCGTVTRKYFRWLI